MSSEDAYSAQWKEYDRRVHLIGWVWLAIIPTIALIGCPLSYFLDSVAPIFVSILLWWVAVLLAIGHRNNWPCPRCGKAFFWAGTHRNMFAAECVHCGLPKLRRAHAEGE